MTRMSSSPDRSEPRHDTGVPLPGWSRQYCSAISLSSRASQVHSPTASSPSKIRSAHRHCGPRTHTNANPESDNVWFADRGLNSHRIPTDSSPHGAAPGRACPGQVPPTTQALRGQRRRGRAHPASLIVPTRRPCACGQRRSPGSAMIALALARFLRRGHALWPGAGCGGSCAEWDHARSPPCAPRGVHPMEPVGFTYQARDRIRTLLSAHSTRLRPLLRSVCETFDAVGR